MTRQSLDRVGILPAETRAKCSAEFLALDRNLMYSIPQPQEEAHAPCDDCVSTGRPRVHGPRNVWTSSRTGVRGGVREAEYQRIRKLEIQHTSGRRIRCG